MCQEFILLFLVIIRSPLWYKSSYSFYNCKAKVQKRLFNLLRAAEWTQADHEGSDIWEDVQCEMGQSTWFKIQAGVDERNQKPDTGHRCQGPVYCLLRGMQN